jgi:hypothetical protein
MSDTFYSRAPETQLRQIVDDLYQRLDDSRKLLAMYDEDTNLTYLDRGYAQGLREEISFLVRTLDKFERS